MIAFGIDIGTTTLRASAVGIDIGPFGKTGSHSLGAPLCLFTPYGSGLLDEEAIVKILRGWADTLPPADVGTILLTGEAQRAPNASILGEMLTQLWPAFFSAQLDPDWETRVAAQGAGAVTLSAQRLGSRVVHFDVGGGTTNIAWLENGEIIDTACLDLGARKWIVDGNGQVLRKTRAAEKIESHLGKAFTRFDPGAVEATSKTVADWILGAAPVPPDLIVVDWKKPRSVAAADLFSFSGGIVDCVGRKPAPFAFGDLGPGLADALLERSREKQKTIHLSAQTGSATAFGVSAFGFQVSGTSIYADHLARLSNVPLFEEAEALAKTLPSLAAVRVTSLGTDLAAMESRAGEWVRRLGEAENPPSAIVFLLEKNLAKSFGYLLKRSAKNLPTQFVVLDELPLAPPAPGFPARTLDIAPTPDRQRYVVTIKSLRLF